MPAAKPTAKSAARSSHPVRVTNKDLVAWSGSLSAALDELRKVEGTIETVRALAALQAGSSLNAEEVVDLLDPAENSLVKIYESLEETTAEMARLA